MFGMVTDFTLDLPVGGTPEIGDELLISSPKGRSVRGYVVRTCRPVKSPFSNGSPRFKLRIMHVPTDDRFEREAMPIRRYGKRLLDRERSFAAL